MKEGLYAIWYNDDGSKEIVARFHLRNNEISVVEDPDRMFKDLSGPVTPDTKIRLLKLDRSGHYSVKLESLKKNLVKVGQHVPVKDEAHLSELLTGQYGLISGHRTGLTPEENDQSNKHLVSELARMGHNFTPIKGVWGGNAEQSFLVHGIDRDALTHLGNQFGQQAVIHGKAGMHEEIATHPEYKGGSKGQGHSILHSASDNYSEIELPNKNKLRFGLNFANMQKSIPKMHLEHYSPLSGIKTIDPDYHGKWKHGAEVKRGGLDNKLAFYYEAGTKPEDMIRQSAKSKYTVELDPHQHKIYPLDQDPEGLARNAIKENQGAWNLDKVIHAMKAAGYHGFQNRSGSLPNAVALFYKHPVKSEDPIK